jgi:uncharacterized protein (TIGR03067 family)
MRTVTMSVFSVVMVVMLVGAAADAPTSAPTSEAVKADLKNLQGTWRVVKAENRGIDVMEKLGYEQFAIEGNTMRVVRNGEERKSQFELDPAHDPKWVNITTPRGDKIEGIYELKGDSWRTASSRARPAGFDDKNAILFVYERSKGAATNPATKPAK